MSGHDQDSTHRPTPSDPVDFGEFSGRQPDAVFFAEEWMTPPRPWPNDCKEARDRAAEKAVEIVKLLDPITGEIPVAKEEIMRRVGKALLAADQIARLLEAVGAQTRV